MATKAHFTPAPWVYKWFGGPQIGGGRDGATAICTLWGSFLTDSPSRQERANRDLICAAPELYAAAEEAAKELAFLLGEVAGGDVPLRNLLTALAKARGMEPASGNDHGDPPVAALRLDESPTREAGDTR